MTAATRDDDAPACSRSLKSFANAGRAMIAETAFAASRALRYTSNSSSDRMPMPGAWQAACRTAPLETGDWRLETGDWRLETGDWRLETGDWRLLTRDPVAASAAP